MTRNTWFGNGMLLRQREVSQGLGWLIGEGSVHAVSILVRTGVRHSADGDVDAKYMLFAFLYSFQDSVERAIYENDQLAFFMMGHWVQPRSSAVDEDFDPSETNTTTHYDHTRHGHRQYFTVNNVVYKI